MYESKMNRFILIIILTPILLLYGCKKPVDLKSKWIDREMVIDADDQDWKDYPFYYDEETRSCIGFYNDNENLYIYFHTVDEDMQRRIASQGLVVWFNETGDKEKQLGIGYPLGRQPRGFGRPMGGSSGIPGPPPDRPSDMSGHPSDMESNDKNIPPKRSIVLSPGSIESLEILPFEDATGYSYNFQRAGKIGIHARCTIDERGRFVYELKMPLMKTKETRFAVATSAVKNIGIGFMSVEPENRSEGGEGKRGRPGRGGPGGGGPGGGRPGGDMPPGGGPDGPGPGADRNGGPGGGKGDKGEDLKIWTRVTLASNPQNIR
jgi:hypothetical protein